MHPQQMLHARERGFVSREQVGDAARDQAVFDRREPGRAFRVVRAHVVLGASDMGDECRRAGCHIFLNSSA
jgi:hypothetical protein